MKLSEIVTQKGFTLPKAVAPVANYVPVVRTGNILIISGQLPFLPDMSLLHAGICGDGVTVEQGVAAAELCGLHILAQIASIVDDVDAIEQVVRLGGFVAAHPDFLDHPQIVNGGREWSGR